MTALKITYHAMIRMRVTLREMRLSIRLGWLRKQGSRLRRTPPLYWLGSSKPPSVPKILVEFFWRYSRLTREQRGHDASASEAKIEEAKAAADALEIHEQNKFFKLMVPSSKMGAKPGHYIVPAPKYTSHFWALHACLSCIPHRMMCDRFHERLLASWCEGYREGGRHL